MMLSGLAEIMRESRESVTEMQKNHEKAATEQAKAAADLSLKAIQAVSASNAKIAVQPATLNCGANGLTPSPADVFAFLEDIKTRYNAILNGIRAFMVRIIRDPTGSVKDFQALACLNEDERKALMRIQMAIMRFQHTIMREKIFATKFTNHADMTHAKWGGLDRIIT